MSLSALGYDQDLEVFRRENDLLEYGVARVTAEHKDRYIIRSEDGEYEAELLGNLRFTAESRYDLPAVGDWVAFMAYDTDKALIHAVYPRRSILERQVAGKSRQNQIIATNLDYGLIILSANRDFNINRVERYLVLCHEAEIVPIVILNKIDLIEAENLEAHLSLMHERLEGVLILPISLKTGKGLSQLQEQLITGKTYCLLGSSGVGKSSLVNRLQGESLVSTGEISKSIDRGRHVTSHRELFVLDSGGIFIDNPGMREVGMADHEEGIEMTFDEISRLADSCKFKDCTHTNEADCAVQTAIDKGQLDHDSYENWQKMAREQAHYAASTAERRRKDKEFGKMVNSIMKIKKKNK